MRISPLRKKSKIEYNITIGRGDAIDLNYRVTLLGTEIIADKNRVINETVERFEDYLTEQLNALTLDTD